jgi:ribosome-binding factor A
MSYPRFLRVRSLLKRELSDIMRADLKDPRLGQITITRIDLSADCKFARVYFSILAQKSCPPEAMQALKSAGGYIRQLLRKRLDLRYIPELIFKFDRNIDYSIKIEKKLAGLKQKDLKNAGDTDS